jgi:hypothetical protein
MGATVREVDYTSSDEVKKFIQSGDAVVIIPNAQYIPEFDVAVNKALEALESVKPARAILLSMSVVEAIEGAPNKPRVVTPLIAEKYPNIYKLKKIEDKFLSIGKGSGQKDYVIVRSSPPQQVMLVFARLLQETGRMMASAHHVLCSLEV